MVKKDSLTHIPEPPLSRFLFADTKMTLVWLVLRIYVGYQWVEAGFGKITNPLWVGDKAGVGLRGFLTNALTKSTGPHADVSSWYASFLHGFVLSHAALFSYIVSFGELLVGIALILGIFTGVAAFFGGFMNMNYLFAGTVSTNPLMFIVELLLILAWRVAGWLGFDRYLLPLLGVPWQPGDLFKKKG
jgi:thiosulfate dehydrogenase [quinone] large subunit